MRIGIDISQIVYEGTGVATYTANLVSSLMQIDSKNDYILFGSTLRRQEKLNQFIQKLHNGHFSKKFYAFPPKILELMWNKLHASNIESFIGQVDIFHSSDWTEPPANCMKITTIHDMLVYKHPEYLNKRIINTQRQKLEWVKKETDVVIADSKSTKQDIIDYLKIPENKIKVIYLGVDPIFSPQNHEQIEAVKRKYNIGGEYLLCVGTREPRKNLANTILAFKQLKYRNEDLVIVGNIGWGKDIEESHNIKVLNFVSRADLPFIYSGAKVFIYPSLYEGFGLPILEAMACGVPVVTSNQGSLLELSGPSYVVDPSSVDSIAKALTTFNNMSAKDGQTIIKSGLKHVAQFTWEKTAVQTLEVYKNVVDNS
jgi:glycosyltransferase involved in cell wall biosynthesis